nr:protein FAR1-RELATED SEQUENCE 5-like [Arachis hypogaea]
MERRLSIDFSKRRKNPNCTTEFYINYFFQANYSQKNTKIRLEFDTVLKAKDFWKSYGGMMSFDVRQLYANKCKLDNSVSSFRLVCTKKGQRRPDKRDHLTKQPRAETRTSCQSYDAITKKDFRSTSIANRFGRPKEIHELTSLQAGGKDVLGYTKQDQKNYFRSKRKRDLAYDEAGSLLKYFHRQLLDNPSFQYATQLDNKEKITNIFWADARMVIDYAIFGDVITFDTTYCTNKENRPLGVFCGFNHHREIVIFGAALLYDESKESFMWLFESFLEAHMQKKPKTIFTDQDPAMASALVEKMPETYHGLCVWHIMQNAIRHLGNKLKDGSFILRDFKACMYNSKDQIQFQETWDALLQRYKVEDNSWLKSIYKVKEKWAHCYMKKVYTIGMRSTQLSESFNSDLKDFMRSNLDIIHFLKQFERAVGGKRYKELQAEYNARQKLPRLKDDSFAVIEACCTENNQISEYQVAIFDKDGEYTQIPVQYIMKRWTREAREMIVHDLDGKVVQSDTRADATARYKNICFKTIKLAARSSDFEVTSNFVEQVIEEAYKKFQLMSITNDACMQWMIELYVEFEQHTRMDAVGDDVNVDQLGDIDWEEDNNDSEKEVEANYKVDDENDDRDLAGNPAAQNEAHAIVISISLAFHLLCGL